MELKNSQGKIYNSFFKIKQIFHFVIDFSDSSNRGDDIQFIHHNQFVCLGPSIPFQLDVVSNFGKLIKLSNIFFHLLLETSHR